jgi:ribosome maturation factor RimP
VRYIANTGTEDPEIAALREPLEAMLRSMGLELIEFAVFRRKGGKGAPGTAQVRLVVYSRDGVGLDECSRAHRALLPRLQLAFPEKDLYVEVSSPGIERLIRDGVEAAHYKGRGLRCYRADIADWQAGILESVDETGMTLRGAEGTICLNYEIIAKAKLDSTQEV